MLRAGGSIVLCLIAGLAAAAIESPPLTGRVVDEANLLSPGTRAQLTERLAQHERETSNQLVIVTLKSLQGYEIEDYGYQLGRAWGIGQEKRNNGVLLIVAPNERKVRIEVGYGLEGDLTDAQSHLIIQNAILPHFREGNFEAGIIEGTDAILGTLAGTYEPMAASPAGQQHDAKLADALGLGFMSLIFGNLVLGWVRPRVVGSGLIGAGTTAIIWIVLGSVAVAVGVGVAAAIFHLLTAGSTGGRSRGGFGGGSGWGGGGGSWGGGGGFSGGGGSFGGGGASGSW
jgi:uncharacterized protein